MKKSKQYTFGLCPLLLFQEAVTFLPRQRMQDWLGEKSRALQVRRSLSKQILGGKKLTSRISAKCGAEKSFKNQKSTKSCKIPGLLFCKSFVIRYLMASGGLRGVLFFGCWAANFQKPLYHRTDAKKTHPSKIQNHSRLGRPHPQSASAIQPPPRPSGPPIVYNDPAQQIQMSCIRKDRAERPAIEKRELNLEPVAPDARD